MKYIKLFENFNSGDSEVLDLLQEISEKTNLTGSFFGSRKTGVIAHADNVDIDAAINMFMEKAGTKEAGKKMLDSVYKDQGGFSEYIGYGKGMNNYGLFDILMNYVTDGKYLLGFGEDYYEPATVIYQWHYGYNTDAANKFFSQVGGIDKAVKLYVDKLIKNPEIFSDIDNISDEFLDIVKKSSLSPQLKSKVRSIVTSWESY